MGVLVTNADELASRDPDVDLAEDVAAYFGEAEAKRLNWLAKDKPPRASTLTLLLIALAAPDDIRQTHQRNNSFAVGPVADFDAFVEAIDYGRVQDRNDSRRLVAVRIDPDELDPSKLLQRARTTGRRPPGLDAIRQSNRDANAAAPSVESRLRSFHRHAPDPPEGLVAGAGVELYLGELRLGATVQRLNLDDGTVKVAIADLDTLRDAIDDRKLATRVKQAETLAIWAPYRSVSVMASAAPAAAPAVSQRTWKDRSGRYEVIATYAGMSGGKVRLSRPGGKQSLVPLEKLSDADQAYVQSIRSGSPAGASPAGAATPPRPKRLIANFRKVKTIEGRDFAQWEFVPPVRQEVARAQPAAKSIDLTDPPQVGAFGPKLEQLVITPDGGAAIAVVSDGEVIDTGRYVQVLDFKVGTASGQARVAPGLVVADASETGQVLVHADAHNSREHPGIAIQQVRGGRLETVAKWEPVRKDAFHRSVEWARFLGPDRVITRTFSAPLVIWDAGAAEALYELELKNTIGTKFEVDPSGRYLAIGSSGGVSLIDTLEGEHVATLEHDLEQVHAIAINEEVTRLAIRGRRNVIGWDLNTGERIAELVAPAAFAKGQLEWVDDLLLAGGEYLLDPLTETLLWQYKVSSREGILSRYRAGRLWYAPEAEKAFPLYVASVESPHRAIVLKRNRLDVDPELLVAKPGDPIHVTVDTDRGPAVEESLRDAVASNLQSAGYVIATEPGADVLHAEVVCKKLPSRQLRINMSRSPIPDEWDIVERRIEPYLSRLAISRDGVELWADGFRADVNGMVFINNGESLDDALKRMTTPDVDRLLEMQFASRISRPGTATPDGAHGLTKLTPDGGMIDSTDAE